MYNRDFFTTEKITRRIALFVMFTLSFAFVANGQKAKCKKWTYDFSETVKYFDTPQEACKAYVKEKYPSNNYKAIVEATNDAETFRCSADDTYIGVVYKRECDSCCNKPTQSWHSQHHFNLQQFVIGEFQDFDIIGDRRVLKQLAKDANTDMGDIFEDRAFGGPAKPWWIK